MTARITDMHKQLFRMEKQIHFCIITANLKCHFRLAAKERGNGLYRKSDYIRTKKRVSDSKCLLLTGARQVGKSTFVKHVFTEYHRADFDDRLTRLQAREEPKLFFLNNPRPLFIDEGQKESSILEEIKQIVDDSDRRGEFILSGSQKLEQMKGVSESLAGRVAIMELTGLSLREIKGISFNQHFIPSEEKKSSDRTPVSGKSFIKDPILNFTKQIGTGRIIILLMFPHILKGILMN